MTDPLQFLQAWYRARSNGHWERCYGITIESLTIPGWLVAIDLEETPLDNLAMQPIRREVSPNDWLVCEVDHNQFRGQGDPEKLGPIIQIFQSWVESHDSPDTG